MCTGSGQIGQEASNPWQRLCCRKVDALEGCLLDRKIFSRYRKLSPRVKDLSRLEVDL